MAEPDSIMSADQREMYRGLVLIRNNEITLRWTRTQIFFLIHSAALSYVATQLKSGTSSHAILSVGGVLLGVLWFSAVVRIAHWVRYWDSRLAALEAEQPVQIFGGLHYRVAARGLTLHAVLLALSVLFVGAWLVLAVFSTWSLLMR